MSIDKAMKWGFGWKLGPFELWDVIGLRKSVEQMQTEGDTVPKWILELLQNGHDNFIKKKMETYSLR